MKKLILLLLVASATGCTKEYSAECNTCYKEITLDTRGTIRKNTIVIMCDTTRNGLVQYRSENTTVTIKTFCK